MAYLKQGRVVRSLEYNHTVALEEKNGPPLGNRT